MGIKSEEPLKFKIIKRVILISERYEVLEKGFLLLVILTMKIKYNGI
jgi:hypothetical protein